MVNLMNVEVHIDRCSRPHIFLLFVHSFAVLSAWSQKGANKQKLE